VKVTVPVAGPLPAGLTVRVTTRLTVLPKATLVTPETPPTLSLMARLPVSWVTVWVRGLELAAAELLSPLYLAVTRWVPALRPVLVLV